MSFDNMQELAEEVEDQIVLVTTLGELRTALGYDRLGRYVLGQIRDELDSHNLGYFPTGVLETNDEPRQYQEVRVYKRNSDAGKVIRAVTHPSPVGDQLLAASVGSSADSTLDKIRALVCVE